MILGLDQFCFHRFFGDVFTEWEQDPGLRWDLSDFLDRAVQMRVPLVGLHTHYLRHDEREFLPAILAKRGLKSILEWGHPGGLRMGTSMEEASELSRWFPLAAELNQILRIVVGYPNYRGREPVAAQLRRLAPVLKSLCNAAEHYGLILAVENHGDLTPFELVELVEIVGEPNLKICFDTGNCVRLDADLLESARAAAPLTAMVHLKDLQVLESSIGNPKASWPSTPLGQGSFDLPPVLDTLQAGGFDGPLMVEMAQMHPNWPDEEVAVAQSVQWLREYLAAAGMCSSMGSK